MSDLLHVNIKGGGFSYKRNATSCGANCSPCKAVLDDMPRKVNTHEHPWAQPNWATFAPHLWGEDLHCLQEDEVPATEGAIPNVPVGYTIFRVYVPEQSILRSIGINHHAKADPYGTSATTMEGLSYDVKAFEVDTTTCPPTVGAAVPDAVPDVFAGLVASDLGTKVAAVAPADGGYHTGTKGLMLAIVIKTPPTNNPLSAMQGSLTIQANIETFNALVR